MNPDPDSFWKVFASLVVLLNVVVMVVGLIRGSRSQKREVTIEHGCASKSEFNAHVADNNKEHENIFHKLGGMERGLKSDMKVDADKLHEKVNAVDRKLAGVERSTDLQNQQLARMEGKLDNLMHERRRG